MKDRCPHGQRSFVFPEPLPGSGLWCIDWLHARRVTETATAALIAQAKGWAELSLCIAQGVDMRRPSILSAKVDTHDGRARVRVDGKCVSAMEGSFQLAGDD